MKRSGFVMRRTPGPLLRRSVGILVLSSVLPQCGGAADLRVESPEIFVEINPATGYLHVKEYYLSTLETDEGAVTTQLAGLSDLVARAAYCPSRFHLASFTPIEESLLRDRGAVTTECHLFTTETKVEKILEAAFGGVLDTRVSAAIGDGEIRLEFDGPDVQVRGNNAIGVYAKGPRRALVWPAGAGKLEAVFGSDTRGLEDFRSLGPYLSADVSSPRRTKAENRARISRAAEDLVVDGSTRRRFEESLYALNARLDSEPKRRLVEALLRFSASFDLGPRGTRADISDAFRDRLRELLDGKTLAEALELSDALSLDQEVAEKLARTARDTAEMGTSADYQHDADILRLEHLRHLGGLIQEFHERTGTYPLARPGDTPNYVFIASPSQRRYMSPIPVEHTTDGVDALERELERVLGRDIVIPFDPQLVPANKPNHYVYMTRGQRYFLAVHLHDGSGFARQLGPHYYKLEISSRPNPAQSIATYDALLADAEFRRRIGAGYRAAVELLVNPEQQGAVVGLGEGKR